MYTVFNIITALMWSHAAMWALDQIYMQDNNSILTIAVLIASCILAGMQAADLLRNIEDKHNQGVL